MKLWLDEQEWDANQERVTIWLVKRDDEVCFCDLYPIVYGFESHQNAGCPEEFCGLPQFFQKKVGLVPEILSNATVSASDKVVNKPIVTCYSLYVIAPGGLFWNQFCWSCTVWKFGMIYNIYNKMPTW